MALRNVYYATNNNKRRFDQYDINWPYDKANPMPFKKSSKIAAANLSKAFQNKRHIKPLEISSVSDDPIGRQASAMNLKFNLGGHSYSVEQLFQAGKVFQNAGSQQKLLNAKPSQAKMHNKKIQAKHDKLIGFQLGSHKYSLKPKTFFYNMLYLGALAQPQNKNVAQYLSQHSSFSDIYANPFRTINTQAESCSIFKALVDKGKFKEAMSSKENFIKDIYGSDGVAPDKSIANNKAANKNVSNNKENPQKGQMETQPSNSIFKSKDQAIVNPVDTFGNMNGKISSQFKKQYPRNFAYYRFFCYKNHARKPNGKFYATNGYYDKAHKWHNLYTKQGQGALQPGNAVFISEKYDRPKLAHPREIINMPVKTLPWMGKHFSKTKDKNIIAKNQAQNKSDYKKESQILKASAENVKQQCLKRHITSIGFPKTNERGYLFFKTGVKPIIDQAFKNSGIKVHYYNVGKVSAYQKTTPKAKKYAHAKQPDNPLKNSKVWGKLRKSIPKNDMPNYLNTLGNLNNITSKTQPKVAVTGWRGMQNKGQEPARNRTLKAIKALDKRNAVIINGLALGSDAYSAEQSLKDGKSSIEVMPAGLDEYDITPAKNRKLFNELMKSDKSLAISAHHNDDYKAKKALSTGKPYIMRDHLISGLGTNGLLATQVMPKLNRHGEPIHTSSGHLKSGTLDTVRHAYRAQHRPIYYIPENNQKWVNNILVKQFHAKPVSDLLKQLDKTNDYQKSAQNMNKRISAQIEHQRQSNLAADKTAKNAAKTSSVKASNLDNIFGGNANTKKTATNSKSTPKNPVDKSNRKHKSAQVKKSANHNKPAEKSAKTKQTSNHKESVRAKIYVSGLNKLFPKQKSKLDKSLASQATSVAAENSVSVTPKMATHKSKLVDKSDNKIAGKAKSSQKSDSKHDGPDLD